MSTSTAIQVPAGWYADPIETATYGVATQRRWWDGTAWTEHLAAMPAPTTPSAVVPATPSPRESARAAQSMPLHSVDPQAGLRSSASAPSSNAWSPLSPANAESAGYEPFAVRERSTGPAVASVASYAPSARNPLSLRVHTVSVWLIATMPLTQALLVFWVFSTLPAESSSWTRALAIVFPFVLSAALADQDNRLMALSGHLRTAPWVLALLAPPAYLALRGVRVARATGATAWPLLVWMSIQLAVLGTWFALDPAAVQAVVSALI